MKQIEGFPGYMIDEEGAVWSRQAGHCKLTDKYHRMVLRRTKRGYLYVRLRHDGRNWERFVHRLVLETFVGLRPNGWQCRHLNGDPTDNRLENLQWGTCEENGSDRVIHGTSPKGSKHGNAKLTEERVKEIRRRFAAGGITQKALAMEFGVSTTTVCNIIKRKRWSHITEE